MPGVDSASKNEYQDIPGGKDGRCVGVRTLPPSCAECHEIWEPYFLEPSGPNIGLHKDYFTFYTYIHMCAHNTHTHRGMYLFKGWDLEGLKGCSDYT